MSASQTSGRVRGTPTPILLNTAQAPTRVLVAGDWHGNTSWAAGVIEQLPQLLPDDPHPLVLHVGDFGLWPGGVEYLDDISVALHEVNGRLMFIDGNHEDHQRLHSLAAAFGTDVVIPLRSRIGWLPRGHRWTWHGRRWLALGGATSVDRPARTAGRDWWAGEAISASQASAVAQAGQADVMVCHDCPAGVAMNLPPAPPWWEMDRAEAHRELLGWVVDEVRPSWLIHGHYHLAHEQTVRRGYGPLHVTGLDRDGALRGNHRVLNVEVMTWEVGQP